MITFKGQLNTLTFALDTETLQYDIDQNGTYEFLRVLDRSRDTVNRDSGFQMGSTPASGVPGGAPPLDVVEIQTAYAYSPTDGRLQTVSGGGAQPPSPANTSTYQYLPNSDLIEKVTGPAHDVINSYEPNRDVLDTKTNKLASTIISIYDYVVDSIGQRTGVNTSGTAFPALPSWIWGYDSLGQVTSADSSVNTSDRAYLYDTIGNRKKSANSLTLPTNDNYVTNALNQYTSIGNQQSAIVNPNHDFDGNMTSGPLPTIPASNSILTWDAENRLTEVKNSARTIIERNQFDSGSRKIATTANGITTLYLYDAWNCIAEYRRVDLQSTSLSKTRLWGTDLSGSQQGAGGVGGLLSETHISNPQSPIYYPTYDGNGNGNISEYLAAIGTVAARFEYDPFGNTVVDTDVGNQFAYRFSTKPLDSAPGFYYYGYRFYDSMTGRWPSRDPIGEKGGVNLYGFVRNKSSDFIDVLEMTPCKGTATHGHATTNNKNRRGLDEEFNEDKALQNDKDPNNNPGPTAYSGCGANSFNKQAVEGGWGCPGTRPNKYPSDGKRPEGTSKNSPHGPNHPDIADDDYLDEDNTGNSLQSAIDAAASTACEKDDCCENASIKIECTGFGPNEQKPVECDTTKEVSCKKE